MEGQRQKRSSPVHIKQRLSLQPSLLWLLLLLQLLLKIALLKMLLEILLLLLLVLLLLKILLHPRRGAASSRGSLPRFSSENLCTIHSC